MKKRTKVNDCNEKMLRKWEETGLLEGLAVREKWELAPVMEEVAAGLLATTLSKSELKIYTELLFPALRRIYSEVDAEVSSSDFINSFTAWSKDNFGVRLTPKVMPKYVLSLVEYYNRTQRPG